MIKKITKNKWIMIGSAFIGVGLTGGIFFFPVNINSQYTCLYHRISSNKDHTCLMGHEKDHHPQGAGLSSDESSKALANSDSSTGLNLRHPELLHFYILPFGLIWWSSLTILFIGGYIVKRNLQNRKRLSSVLPKI